jgi:long-subunit acyl-CoA synthetase (AMP-forming)
MPGQEFKIFRKDSNDEVRRAPPLTTMTTTTTPADGASAPVSVSVPARVPEDTQGELCYRGRHIMMGYMANPEMGEAHVEDIKRKNAEAVDPQGWFHSGDKGAMDELGMCKITGRFKELIVSAGGENVAPVPLEDKVKQLCPAVSNIMMVGDKRKFNTALVTLHAGGTGEDAGGSVLTGGAAGFVEGVTTVEAACASKEFTDEVAAAIQVRARARVGARAGACGGLACLEACLDELSWLGEK